MRGVGRRLTLTQARHTALAAQGFADKAPRSSATSRHVRRVVDRVHVIQIDSVNVLARSQYLPFFARLGSYDQGLVDALRDRRPGVAGRPTRPGALVEYWAHEASLISVHTWPYLAFRMRRQPWQDDRAALDSKHPGLLRAVTEVVTAAGPLTSRQVEAELPTLAAVRREHWGWNWSATKTALEHLFAIGELTSAGRTAQFERRYAALDVVLPPEVAAHRPGGGAELSDAECGYELMRLAARAHGVGTEACLRDYFRLPAAMARRGLDDLLDAGEVEPVTIEGWNAPAYLHCAARSPRGIAGSALLSPFDSLIWRRVRAERLFGFTYRIEIYVPQHKRVHGYYVLPFLRDGALVGRVDLKADRAAGVLRVQRFGFEPDAPTDSLTHLLEELHRMATWLGLNDVVLP
ncbi:MAG: crosslink repair DNA glycosylase YcaQ family protein, partial [Ornithinimicrobium sp.]